MKLPMAGQCFSGPAGLAEMGTHVSGALGSGSWAQSPPCNARYCDYCQMDKVQSQGVGKIFLLKTFQSEQEMFFKSGGNGRRVLITAYIS